jgi:YbbR domain-containing protein
LQKAPKVPEGQRLQFRQKALMFSVFLIISVVIWMLNALSKNYTTTLEYPLVYTDFPKDRVFVGEMPGHLNLEINAHGYALLRYQIFKKPVPISFKISAFNRSQRSEGSSEYIVTRNLRDQISAQLPSELRLLTIKPDTLHFSFTDRISRRVEVRPEIVFTIDNQFTVKDGIQLSPDSVEVTGPDLILDTLDFVSTEKMDLGLLTRDYTDKVRLKPIPELQYAVSRVDCSIELERFTEIQVPVPIRVLNLPDTISLQTFPSRVILTCRVGLSKYERIEGFPFRAEVDYALIDERTRVLNVTLSNLPDYLLSYEYSPKSVEFLKSRK